LECPAETRATIKRQFSWRDSALQCRAC
jgi:hypothetical protein